MGAVIVILGLILVIAIVAGLAYHNNEAKVDKAIEEIKSSAELLKK